MIPCCRGDCSRTWTRSFRGWVRPISTRSRSTHPSARSRASSATDTCRWRSRRAVLPISPTGYEQAHIASALVFELSKVEHVHVREAMVGHLRHIEEDLAKRVAAGLAFDKIPDAPVAAASVKEMKPSPALQIIGKMKNTLMGRAIGI